MGFLSFILALIAIGLLIVNLRQRKTITELETKQRTLRSELVSANSLAATYQSQVTTARNELNAERKKGTATNLVDTARTLARDTATKFASAAPAPKPAVKRTPAPAPVRRATSTSRPSSSRSYGSRSSSYNDGTDLVTGLALGAAIASSSDYGSSSSSYSSSSDSSSSYSSSDSGSSGGGWE